MSIGINIRQLFRKVPRSDKYQGEEQASNATPSFIYQPLEHIDSIRIVEVLPKLKDGMIQLQMWQGQSPAPYRCLSYMWGAPFANHEILINGGRFRVGDNLHRFLHTARRLYPSQPLWIDAICINQRDLTEKGHQVQAMGHIYRKAKEVLIWLGVELDLDQVFDVADDPSTWSRLPPTLQQGLERLCDHPYWYRSWITQEILLAAHVRVLYKHHDVTWRHLGDMLSKSPTYASALYDTTLSVFWKKTTRKPSICIAEPTIDSAPQQSLGKPPSYPATGNEARYTLWSLLGWRTRPICYDVRDRIYALLALVDNGHSFEVDYGEDVASLFWRAGGHFEAWNDVYFVSLLCSALDVSTAMLKDRLSRMAPFCISYAVRQMFLPEDWARYDTETSEHCIHIFAEREEHDILFCMHDKQVWGKGPHVLLRPINDEAFMVLFVPAFNSGHAPHPRAVRPMDILDWRSGSWAPLKDLSSLFKVRRSPGPHHGLLPYKVQVPAEWMLEMVDSLRKQ